jgi:hypothetical protein
LARPSSSSAYRQVISPAGPTLRFSFDSPSRTDLRMCGHPLMRFGPPTGCDPHGPPDRLSAPAPPIGFDPLWRQQLRESTPPGFTSPGTFPPRGFSPPRGFAPPEALRVCFTPLAPVGFVPPGVCPSQEAAAASSAVLCPHGVDSRSPPAMTRPRWAPPTHAASIVPRPFRAFRALSPPGVRAHPIIG